MSQGLSFSGAIGVHSYTTKQEPNMGVSVRILQRDRTNRIYVHTKRSLLRRIDSHNHRVKSHNKPSSGWERKKLVVASEFKSLKNREAFSLWPKS